MSAAAAEGNTSIAIDPVTGKHVPMKDGRPCRVCTDFKTWSRLEKEKSKKEKTEEKTSSSSTAQTAAAASTAATSTVSAEKAEEEWRKKNCPVDVEQLGNATWTLLHTMAAYYPDRPAPSQMESMKTFINSFAEHYPCWYCKVGAYIC